MKKTSTENTTQSHFYWNIQRVVLIEVESELVVTGKRLHQVEGGLEKDLSLGPKL
jgi:hypothetical protein